MGLDRQDFNDKVVFDLLNFLDLKIDSTKELETWFSSLPYGRRTELDKLFDSDSCLLFSYVAENVCLVNVEEKKLLKIAYTLPIYYGLDQTSFTFALFDNVKDFIIQFQKEKNGDVSIKLSNNKGIDKTYRMVDNVNQKERTTGLEYKIGQIYFQ